MGGGVSVVISAESRYVCLADGQKVPFEEYTAQSREFILDVSHTGLDELLRIWIDKGSRKELREALRDRDIYTSAFRHYLDLSEQQTADALGLRTGSVKGYASRGLAKLRAALKQPLDGQEQRR